MGPSSPMNPAEAELVAAVRLLVLALRNLEVEYFVGGSIASMVFGEPRLTLDADVVARLRMEHADRIVALLGSDFYADLDAIRAAIDHHRSFNLIHLETMVKIDVYVAAPSAFVESEFARRIRRDVSASGAPLELDLATPEDVVLAKLEWFRRGGEVSDRQWRDVLGVLKVQGNRLDVEYLQRWAPDLRVEDLLQRARDEAGQTGG